MPKLAELVPSLNAKGYMGWPIGGVLREYEVLVLKKKPRADKCILESNTYAHFRRGQKLDAKFDRSSAIPGFLRWIHEFKGNTIDSVPVLVDRRNGIVVQQDNGKEYFGCLSDVVRGLYYKTISGNLSPWGQSGPASASEAMSPTPAEVKAASSSSSIVRSVAANGRRINQDFWRKQVLEKWNHQCVISGSALGAILRASHIKKYKRGCESDDERQDPENGLCLAGTYDLLFEYGYFTFGEDGRIILSPSLPKAERECLNMHADIIETYLKK
ncbi:MAG: HNH endonuclease [Opitutaceae bacterium]|nr:HNH endonuclease [Opitutaceae bacterium]